LEHTLTNTSPRIPLEAGGIQVNFCKNPNCANYAIPASVEKQPRGRGNKIADRYTISGGAKRKGKGEGERITNTPVLACLSCGEYPPIKSNQGILEEKNRMLSYLHPRPANGCKTPGCPNREIGIGQKKGHYRLSGKTKSGSQRYLCLACNKTFSVGSPTLRQRIPHKNVLILKMLVNKVPLRRICVIAGIGQGTLYDKIDFFHRQCVAFAADKERQLLQGLELPGELYISVDRQDHLLNWSLRFDKRNTAFQTIGSADNVSGYIFGLHLNFDPAARREEVEAETLRSGDHSLRPPFRRHARLWLSADLPEAQKEVEIKATAQRMLSQGTPPGGLVEEIKRTYLEVENRGDVEVSDVLDATKKLPDYGMLVHSEYTMYGHFYFLKELLQGAKRIHFFLDQESGIRASCLAAFSNMVMERNCDAFYVRINKTLTVNQKRKVMADLRYRLDEMRTLYPYDVSNTSLRRMLIEENLKSRKPLGPWRDQWIEVPSQNMSEPEKHVCHLTDFRNYGDFELATLLDKASLHGIDRFFMQIRRLLSPMERPIRSASSSQRAWHQYSLYRPDQVGKLLEIFRVYYNFLKKGDDGKTPAMRLGLCKCIVQPGELVNFSTAS